MCRPKAFVLYEVHVFRAQGGFELGETDFIPFLKFYGLSLHTNLADDKVKIRLECKRKQGPNLVNINQLTT